MIDSDVLPAISSTAASCDVYASNNSALSRAKWPHARCGQDDIDERVQASEPVRDTQERGVGRWQRGAQPTLEGDHDPRWCPAMAEPAALDHLVVERRCTVGIAAMNARDRLQHRRPPELVVAAGRPPQRPRRSQGPHTQRTDGSGSPDAASTGDISPNIAEPRTANWTDAASVSSSAAL